MFRIEKWSTVEYAPKEETYFEGSNALEEKYCEEKHIFIQVKILLRKHYKYTETGEIVAMENCE